ncbi:ATP-dependent metallopeptidase FtsH/Yme1/Tma family protein [Nonomuraea muscovyensis]
MPPARTGWRPWLVPIGTLIFLSWLLVSLVTGGSESGAAPYSYTAFVAKVTAGQVKAVTIDDQGEVSGTLNDGTRFTSQIPTALDVSRLEPQLRSHRVEITATRTENSLVTLLLGFLPLAVLIGLFMWMGRKTQQSLTGGIGGIGGFGRSRAKIIEAERPTTRFGDVAGYEGVKQEISEVVDFLRAPDRYAAVGAKPPRGVIMVGPPGTGKTLFARAVAGEADVPFLSVTGSAFVEMFVGVGASRVREPFQRGPQARPLHRLHRRDRRHRRAAWRDRHGCERRA